MKKSCQSHVTLSTSSVPFPNKDPAAWLLTQMFLRLPRPVCMAALGQTVKHMGLGEFAGLSEGHLCHPE